MFDALPAYVLRAQGKVLELSTPKVMGIVNVTPDSFSDGGCYNTVDSALAQVQTMVNDGATIIDIGAESTRPNAAKVSTAEELSRLTPIVQAVRHHFPALWLSIDTSTPEVMAQMARLGADIWNDVRGLKRAGAKKLAAELGLPVVVMHGRGEPDTMHALSTYADPITDIKNELQQLIGEAQYAGVQKSQIILDVGMGFAKEFATHQALMRELHSFMALGYPMLFGVSRKRFLGEVLATIGKDNSNPCARDNIGVTTALLAVQQGASIIRTHNVPATVEALALWQLLCNKH